MIDQAVPTASAANVEAILRDELARGDVTGQTVLPILRHLIAAEDSSVFSDEILARVRGMVGDLAGQLLDRLVASGGDSERRAHLAGEVEALTGALIDNAAILRHLHCLALEWQLTERLQARLALDPVVPPLLQALVASPDAATQAVAMNFLASQARFCQSQRRMKLPLGELPGEQLHGAIVTLRTLAGADALSAERAALAEAEIRTSYNEAGGRLGLAARLVVGMGGGAVAALAMSHAGVALFTSALAHANGQNRDDIVLATHESQVARLALSLRAAGLKPASVEEQFLALHPEISLPEGFDRMGADRAAAILAAGQFSG